jgi:hypothetical protein
LVPTDANLLDEYDRFSDVEAACVTFCDEVNGRTHRVTRRVLGGDAARGATTAHRVPDHPYTIAFGDSRPVVHSCR